MDSKEYWQLRAEEKARMGDKTSMELLSTMQSVYDNSLKGIQKEIEAFYGRYATQNGLTMAEVNKRLNPSELKSAKRAIKEYYDFADPSKIGKNMSDEYRDELRLLSAKAYMSRLEELKASLKHEMIKLGAEENKQFDVKLKDLYAKGYNTASYNVDLYKGYSVGFSSMDSKQISKLINERWLGNNYSDRIWKNKDKLLESLTTTFSQGVARGQNALKIAKQMQADYNTSLYNCERLARTETQHILNEATLESYKDHDVSEYEFVATLDEKTCPYCGGLDGQHFKISNKLEGENYPVMHPNCRCTTVPYFEKDEIDKLFEEDTRIARRGDGSVYYVPQSMNYAQWLKLTTKPPVNPDLNKTVREVKKQQAETFEPSDDEDSYNVPFAKQNKELKYTEDMKYTNPDYIHSLFKHEGYEKYQYTQNCQRVAIVYEYRRRGYKVKALPKKYKGESTYHFTHECWRNKDGSIATYENVKSTTRDKTVDKLISTLSKYPKGSRFEIIVRWDRYGGHAFNAEIDNEGRLHLICAQTCTGMEKTLRRAMYNKRGLSYMYLNDKKIKTSDLKTIMEESND